MTLTLTGRRVTITDAVRQHINRKLQQVDRVLRDGAVSTQCALALERGKYRCDVTVRARETHVLRGAGRGATAARAITLAVDKILQQAKRLKGRWQERRRVEAKPGEARTHAVPAQDPVAKARVFRSRRAVLKPTTLDDAMLVLATGDREFLVFRDAATDAISVLYRRPDGHFGLIEPEP